MKIISPLIAILLLTIPSYAINGYWQWAITAQDNGIAEMTKLTVDENGNTYATGTFQGSIQFGASVFTSNGKKDAWVAKFDSNGGVVWARSLGSTDNDEGRGITTDNTGNVYVTGIYESTLYTTSTDSLLPFDENDGYTQPDIFIIKYDANGQQKWLRGAGGKHEDYSSDIKSDNIGHVYIIGNYGFYSASPLPDTVSIAFDTDTLFAFKGNNSFIVKYDTLGNIRWTKNIGEDQQTENLSSIKTDNNGNIYIGGSFKYDLSIDHIYMIADPIGWVTSDIFIAKIDSTGKAIWARNISPQKKLADNHPGILGLPSLAVSNNGLYICGGFINCDMVFPGSVKITAVFTRGYLARFDAATGALAWAQKVELPMGLSAIAADKDENTYTVATYWNSNIVMLKHDKAGKLIYEDTATGAAFPLTIATDVNGGIYVGGYSSNNLTFGQHSITMSDGDNIFLAKYHGNPTAIPQAPFADNDISIYPNPFQTQIFINGLNKGDKITLTDMYGRAVYTGVTQAAGIPLSIGRDLPSGNYIITVTGSNGINHRSKMVTKL